MNFIDLFTKLTGHPPFPWQQALYEEWFYQGKIPQSCNLPTGLGKTSVIAVWLIARANGANVPRRLVYVVNRRTVVDQTTIEVEKYRNAKVPGIPDFAISTLRGQFADNREWSADPSRPAVICGTVDMIGSRLLFSGYGIGFKQKPLHAGFLGQDALLVHDEAHLEPAFQELVMAIEKEQGRCKDFHPLRIMELTATRRGEGEAFELTKEEREIPPDWAERPNQPIRYVWQRMKAKKALGFKPANRDSVAKVIGETARSKWATSGNAVLVFVRTIDDVKTVFAALTDKRNGGVEQNQVQVLTGTLRGLERDRMANPREETGCPVFARFLPKPKEDASDDERWKVQHLDGTVYLVCTSAGEVGVDISADHMVCDLSTLDSMAQRFGRVNRRGEGAAEIDVVFETDPDPKKKDDAFERARWKTKEILERLAACTWSLDRREASPSVLGLVMKALTDHERAGAFAPPPTLMPATDILFDSWALTTIRGKLPGRPPVEPYLHGLPTDWQPPETQVAWREEVERITGDLLAEYKPSDLLDAYPLKPHELLKEPSYRAFKHFEAMAKRLTDQTVPVWLLDDDGKVEAITLVELADKDSKERINGKTVLLPPRAGGLEAGMLNGAAHAPQEGSLDVADDLFIKDSNAKRVRQRKRLLNADPDVDPDTKNMHSVVTISFPGSEDGEEEDGDVWYWLALGNEGDKSAKKPVLWGVHVADVEREAKSILDKLTLDPKLRAVVEVAAKYHDHGKRRKKFQLVLGNLKPDVWWAKSGKKSGAIPESYRHEFGSLLDIREFRKDVELDDDQWELVLHLIATHHGRARPHFPEDEAFDPEGSLKAAAEIASEVPRRYARLQRKYGRWGLAYLESLLRAADWAASAKPSAFVEDAS